MLSEARWFHVTLKPHICSWFWAVVLLDLLRLVHACVCRSPISCASFTELFFQIYVGHIIVHYIVPHYTYQLIQFGDGWC